MVSSVASSSLKHEVDRLLAHDPDVLRDPYPLYRRLREEAPVFTYDATTALVSTYAEAKTVYRDNDRFPSPERLDSKFEGRFALLSAEEMRLYDEWIAFESTRVSRMNGEQHRRVRSAGQRAFTPRRLEEMRATVTRLTDRLLDELEAEESADFMRFAYRLPLLVILDMMGVPHEDGPILKRWCDSIARPAGENPLRPETIRSAHSASSEFRAYVRELVRAHRRRPERTTLVAALLDASAEDRVSEPELLSMYVLVMFAGHETTTNMFGNGLLALLRHREQWQAVCGDPSLVPGAVEEVLRYDAPAPFIYKSTIGDEQLAGVSLPAGTSVVVLNGAANRDPLVFDDPDGLDVTRRPNDHLSFGYGVHFCLGAGLARMEGDIGFRALVRRFPEVELATDPEQLSYLDNFTLRALRSLPVKLA
jgi:hypothetical protein